MKILYLNTYLKLKMDKLNVFSTKDLAKITQHRSGEIKFGEKIITVPIDENWIEFITNCEAKFVLIGLPEDIMNAEMALALGAFTQENRSIRLEVTAGLSRELMQSYRNGQFDIVIVKETVASADHLATFPEQLAWFESLDYAKNWHSPIPLVAFPQGGLYREEMFEQLERKRQHWYIAFTGNSLSNVLISVEAGLGLSLLPIATTKNYRVREYLVFGKVSPIAVSIYAWDQEGLIAKLVQQMTNVLQHRFNEFHLTEPLA